MSKYEKLGLYLLLCLDLVSLSLACSHAHCHIAMPAYSQPGFERLLLTSNGEKL